MPTAQAQLMNGTDLARTLIDDTARRAAALTRDQHVVPTLATVLVGDDPASVTYVRMKQKRCERAGLRSEHVALPASTSTAQLVDALGVLSADPGIHGILLQHPVGDHIDERAAFDAIAPEKDVDGVTSQSFAAMALGGNGFASCTPGGIIRLLDHYAVDPAGMHAVVVGRSPILGRPVGMLLLGRNATVTYCHSHTRNLGSIVSAADLLVAAVGKPNFIVGEDIKPGAVVIDAGYNAGNIGDVEFSSARTRASLITPVPGGVGPMTIATLLAQTIDAAEPQTTAGE
ncbi:bifunctional 5,10-methylene-tetrahydrofolate dehydrogenase/5,10-methylene-tetrahydrofolate cyclohydrolase [Antrihabitans sp. YC3-6]|uniref:Bifunctional protein FolD n=1 Tax=Antrihabitans stalagmiti TaxID=2799499 RepID=A0A934U1I4_9NOCA|nr:tetrahydrofolate dehydrogenase/cyclohydrolase catalytic domain-containing protein [Antrihabitans stalagmiti]MBJ8337443.1 bifunctional 5,10-methylene-tetrahydrofolate dehydrogenase/5,10-methylene-tetrahydrofolate cyclohydrolase [Antrihabitans stalagmiti]